MGVYSNMKYQVHQIRLSNALINEVNRLGHAEAAEKYSVYKAHLSSTSGKYEAWMRSMYSHVANIDAHSLESVFEYGNIGPEDRIERLDRMHSVSVGDLIRDPDGVWHLCAPIGWQVVFVEQKVAA